MRHFLLLAGSALVFAGTGTSGSGDPMVLVWLAALLVLVIWPFLSFLKRGRMRADLLAGKGVIARWQVSLADLVAFQAVDLHRASDGENFRNRLSIRNSAPGEGVTIAIGERGWLIGDRLYRWGANDFGVLANVFTFDGDPGYIEVALLETRDGQAWSLALLRLPVPIHARPAARAAATDLAARVRRSDRDALWDRFPEYACGVEASED